MAGYHTRDQVLVHETTDSLQYSIISSSTDTA